jgi:SAM-dependent methyltransferase
MVQTDVDELVIRLDSAAAIDVLFDGRRVWSITPDEHPRGRGGLRRIAWPGPIREQLAGSTTIELREHVSGTILASADVTFGTAAGRVEIVDDEGRPVALTKYGRLNHPFESSDRASVEGYLDQVEQVLAVLADECGLPAFVSFGTLLGAVRTGHLIGHDVDVDLGYLSSHQHPVDVVRETLRVERVFRDKGWRVIRQNNGFLALFFDQADGTVRNLDVFACFTVGEMLYQVHDVRTRADGTAVLPLTSVTLEGRSFPAPARPEVFLEAAYGPSWRVPDPSFEYRTPPETRRRITGWLGGLRAQRDQWSGLYGQSPETPPKPSALARLVARTEAASGAEPGANGPCGVVDIGCGRGRDALFLAKRGFATAGVDFVGSALRLANETAVERRLDVDWQLCNLYSLQETLLTATVLARNLQPRVVLSRGLLQDLTDAARLNFWRMTRIALAGGGRAYLEFWTRPRSDAVEPSLPVRTRWQPSQLVREAVRYGGRVNKELTLEATAGLGGDPGARALVVDW